jgi:hypothetical protein
MHSAESNNDVDREVRVNATKDLVAELQTLLWWPKPGPLTVPLDPSRT